MNHSRVADIGLLKAHGNVTKVFELAKEILRQMLPPGHLRVVDGRLDAGRLGRNYRPHASVLQLSAQGIAVIGSVRNSAPDSAPASKGDTLIRSWRGPSSKTYHTRLPRALTITLILVLGAPRERPIV